MQYLAQSPIMPHHVIPHIGRPVAAILPNGEVVCGIVDRVCDGHLVMRPLDRAPEAAVMNVTKQPKPRSPAKAKIKAWGYPYGWGYGNYGWGPGWWWIWPLVGLTALAAFPFFFW
jgi:hypothetical protein